jgi:hypothetical protein
MNHVLIVAVGVTLMLAGAVMLVTGPTSVVPFAAIAVGIALTVVDRHQHHPG